MHLYVAAKGIKPHLEQWQNDLLAQKLPLMKEGKQVEDDKGNKMFVQLAVRPLQLFEIGFPEEHLQAVLSIVGQQDDYILKRYKILRKFAAMVRKFLKLKKVPQPEFINPLMQPNQYNKAVAVVPIGLKEDIKSKDGFEQL